MISAQDNLDDMAIDIRDSANNGIINHEKLEHIT